MINNLNLKLSGQELVTREELFELVSSWGRKSAIFTFDDIKIEKCESNECYDLSNLDVSQITNLSHIFCNSLYNGDLSKWDVSNCTNMDGLFCLSNFNNDSIFNWNVSNVIYMDYIFYNSKFNGDLSNWDVKNVVSLLSSFTHSEFNNNSISNWNISNVETMTGMFEYAKFSGDISSWEFKKHCHLISLFNSNDNFKNKYNFGKEIPYHTKDFLKWFEENRDKMKDLNQGTKEEVLDFFSFDSSNKELNKL